MKMEDRIATRKGLTTTAKLKKPDDTVFSAQKPQPRYREVLNKPNSIRGFHSCFWGMRYLPFLNKYIYNNNKLPAKRKRIVPIINGGADKRPNLTETAPDAHRIVNKMPKNISFSLLQILTR
jgi:hypothetical protein